jgi:hypothetical protein
MVLLIEHVNMILGSENYSGFIINCKFNVNRLRVAIYHYPDLLEFMYYNCVMYIFRRNEQWMDLNCIISTKALL